MKKLSWPGKAAAPIQKGNQPQQSVVDTAPWIASVIHQAACLLEGYELRPMFDFGSAKGGNITAINPLLLQQSLRIAKIIFVLYSIPFNVQLTVVYLKGLETCDLFHNTRF